MATAKFIKNNAGTLTEESALTASAGAGDTGKIPALNASGVLAHSIVNAVTTGGTAGEQDKLVALDSAGRINVNMLPVGVGADTADMTASETVANGDLVNIWDSTGPKIRKAVANVAGKEAHGFVLVGGAAAAVLSVYFEGSNTAVTGLVPGPLFLSSGTAGLTSATAPSGAGNVVQRVGFAISATVMNFQAQTPVVLA